MSEDALDDYLWDRSGPADEELRRLEALLARYRFNRPPPAVFDEPAGGSAEPDM